MTDELQTDDEVLRERGATDGPKKIAGLTLRPMSVLTLSQMQRNELLGEGGDMLQKTAAFAFLHSAPRDEIRAVVNNREKFFDAVDAWLDRNFGHHDELEPLAGMMAEAFETYMAAKSTGSGPYQGNGSKN
jgi:hypothetical protein